MKKQALLLITLLSCTQAHAQPTYQDCIDFVLKNKKEIVGITLLTAAVAYITFKLYYELNKPAETLETEEDTENYTTETVIVSTQEPAYDYSYTSPTYYPRPTTTYIQPVIYQQPQVIVTKPVVYRPLPVVKPAPYVAPVQPITPKPVPAPAPTSIKHPTYFDRLLDRQMDILQ